MDHRPGLSSVRTCCGGGGTGRCNSNRRQATRRGLTHPQQRLRPRGMLSPSEEYRAGRIGSMREIDMPPPPQKKMRTIVLSSAVFAKLPDSYSLIFSRAPSYV